MSQSQQPNLDSIIIEVSRQEQKRQYRREHYLRNQKIIMKYSREYYWRNRERDRVKRRKRTNNERRINRKILMKYLGGIKCSDCGCKYVRILELHHMNREDSIEDRRRFINNHSMTTYYIKHPDEAKHKLQVLCRNCHSKTRIKYK